MSKNVIDVLKERGFIEAMTSDELPELANKPLKVYVGFDPTSDSLHVGNMVAIMGLAWFQKLGHKSFAVVGGATGMVGDPSGKASERSLLDSATIEANLRGIRNDLEGLLDFHQGENSACILNNYDWFESFGFIEFLRDVGKLFRVGPMLAKESVRSRLNSEEGMSFTEFTYQLLQAYDFLHLFDHHGVSVQLGGSDQWGNITAGTDLIRKVRGQAAHGVTFPLLTRSDGKKFGKSESGTIWLSPERLSPYEFYQYFVRVQDEDVIRLMRMLTFMEMEEIKKIEHSMQSDSYEPNNAQKRLAQEVTELVHGKGGLQTAMAVTKAANPGSQAVLDVDTLENLAADMPCTSLPFLEVEGVKFIDVAQKAGLVSSKGEAKRLVRNGGAYLNNERVENEDFTLSQRDFIGGRLALLGSGKKKKVLLRLIEA